MIHIYSRSLGDHSYLFILRQVLSSKISSQIGSFQLIFFCAKFCHVNLKILLRKTHLYRRLHLPVNPPLQNMLSPLSFRCQTLKFSRPNVKCLCPFSEKE